MKKASKLGMLFAWLSLVLAVPVRAQTTWNFTYTGSNGTNDVNVAGTLLINSAGFVSGIIGVVGGAGPGQGDGNIIGLLSTGPGSGAFYCPTGIPPGGACLDSVGFYFEVPGQSGTYYWQFSSVHLSDPASYLMQFYGNNPSLLVSTYGPSTDVTFQEVGVLPEINATALPRAVLLLGCIYLVARNRQDDRVRA